MKSDFPFLSALPSGKSLEGYLYPDTYFLDPNSSIPEQLIKSQLKNFNQKVWIPLGDQLQSFGYGFDSYKLLTLASVIENEEKLAGNQILANLSDASNLYNTRQNYGLPPTPISSPSVETISATLDFKKTGALYYLHDASGKIHYGTTLEEHNENKKNYL